MIFNPTMIVKGGGAEQQVVNIVTRGTAEKTVYYTRSGLGVQETIPGASDNLIASVETNIDADIGTVLYIAIPDRNAGLKRVTGATQLITYVYLVDA